MSVKPCPRKVLLLYKDLLKYGKNLELSDKEYYMRKVRTEFRENKSLRSEKAIEFQYNKGLTLLKNKRIL